MRVGEEETEDKRKIIPRGETSKPGVRFYEFGLGGIHVQACTHTGGEPQTKARLIQTALAFLSLKIPGLLSVRGTGIIFRVL